MIRDRQNEEVLFVSYDREVSERSIISKQYALTKKETETFPHLLLPPVFINIAHFLSPTIYPPPTTNNLQKL